MNSCNRLEDFKDKCPNYNCKSGCPDFRKKVIPTSMGSDAEGQPFAPKNGDYRNALVYYEASGVSYIYGADGIPTKIAQISSLVNSVNGKTGDVVITLSELGGKTQEEIQALIDAKAIEIEAEIPTKTSELENDSNYQNSSQVSSAISTAIAPINSNIARIDANIDDIEQNIDDIEALIPEQATAENKLADKAFVNSSISTNTATFRGTYAVEDLGLTYDATHEEVAAALATVITTVTNNDYSFVYFTDQTTGIVERYDRYKYSVEETAWSYEYTLNNSSFTADQWAAINSGISSGDVEKLAGIEEGAEVNAIDTIKVQGATQAITDKTVDLDVATTDDLEELINFKSAIGKSANVIDAIDYKLGSVELFGDTEQATTAGYQLFDKENIVSGSINASGEIAYSADSSVSDYIEVDGDETLTRVYLKNSAFYDEDKSFISRVSVQNINVPSNAKYIRIEMLNTQVDTEQLEKGSVSHPYEPYTGGMASPSPDYPKEVRNVKAEDGELDLVVAGKNLLNVPAGDYSWSANSWSIFEDGTIAMSRGNPASQGGVIDLTTGETRQWAQPELYDHKIIYRPGTYIFSTITSGTLESNGENLAAIYFSIFDNNGNFLRAYNFPIIPRSQSGTLTYNNYQSQFSFVIGEGEHLGAVLLYGQYFQCTNLETKVQLEVGSIATSYEPYKSKVIPFQIGTTEFAKIGNVSDKLWVNLETGEYGKTANIGKVVLDGSENWYTQGTVNYQVTFAGTSRIHLKQGGVGYSNYFAVKNSGDDIYLNPILQGSTDYIRIVNALEKWQTIADWSTWLSTHNTEVYYPLDAPTTTTLGTLSEADLKKLRTYRGINNFTTTGSIVLPDISLVYPSLQAGGTGNIDDVKVNGSSVVSDRVANITVPTRTSDLENDSNFVEDENYVHTDNNYTTGNKDKLTGLANIQTIGNNLTLTNGRLDATVGKLPYTSLERLASYLYKVSFEEIPEENSALESAFGSCSSYVQGGKLYRNLDWKYDETASFFVECKGFKGMSFINGLNDTNMDTELIGQLPYHMVDGVNENGIMVSTHVLFNDWEWQGTGSTSLGKVPYLILSRLTSMDNIEEDLAELVSDVYATPAMVGAEYLVHFVITDGTTTYTLTPPTSSTGSYQLIDITANPKLTNFRWVEDEIVVRQDLQTRPTGVERWNLMPTTLENLRFTKAYENPNKLSEFIGIDNTTKDSTDEELEAIYQEAHTEYESRIRDGKTWQTVHSVIYSNKGLESLCVQEEWDRDYAASGGAGNVEDVEYDDTSVVDSNGVAKLYSEIYIGTDEPPKEQVFWIDSDEEEAILGDATITITQGGVTKGSFSANQETDVTIALDTGVSSVSWGDIEGDIADQTDLGQALTDKLDANKVKTSQSTTSGDVYDVTYINTTIGNIEALMANLYNGGGAE